MVYISSCHSSGVCLLAKELSLFGNYSYWGLSRTSKGFRPGCVRFVKHCLDWLSQWHLCHVYSQLVSPLGSRVWYFVVW
jgi:hypothetical protein